MHPVNQAIPGRLVHHGSFGRMALSLPAWPSAVPPAPTFNSITRPATSFIRQFSKCSDRPDGRFLEAVHGGTVVRWQLAGRCLLTIGNRSTGKGKLHARLRRHS
jgi:hypothetical protein